MSDELGYSHNLRRGQLLRQSRRYQEAARFLGQAIEADPGQAQAYLELALAQAELPQQKSQALETIDRAVALEPNSAHYLGYKAFLLCRFSYYAGALQFANSALAINPDCYIAILAKANSYTKLSDWREAEVSARRLLELNAQDTEALNLLAQTLRFQGRIRESREIVAQILALVPNDAFGHLNAGYGALKVHDYRRAEEHFLSALRFDPHFESARYGYLESLRMRSWFFRVNSRLITYLEERRWTASSTWFFMAIFFTCGLFLVVILLYVIAALTLRPLAYFFLLLHPTARHMLNAAERRQAWRTTAGVGALLAALALAGLDGEVVAGLVYLGVYALSLYLPHLGDAFLVWWEKTRFSPPASGPS